MNSEKEKSTNAGTIDWVWNKGNIWGLPFLFLLFFAWFFTPALVELISGMPQGNDTAAIGDSYGWYNALVSTFVFVFVALGFMSQREGLKVQRAELELQRKAMEDQRQELKTSADGMTRQVEIASLTAQLNVLPEMANDLRIRIEESFKMGGGVEDIDLSHPTRFISEYSLLRKELEKEVRVYRNALESGNLNDKNELIRFSSDGVHINSSRSHVEGLYEEVKMRFDTLVSDVEELLDLYKIRGNGFRRLKELSSQNVDE